MHTDCAMAGADSGAARTGGGSFARSAGRGVAGNHARRVVARDTASAFRRAAVRGRGCSGGFGSRNLVGPASGVVQQSTGRDGGAAGLVSVYCDA